VLKHLRALERQSIVSLSGKSRGIRIIDEEVLEACLANLPEDALPRDAAPAARTPLAAANVVLDGSPTIPSELQKSNSNPDLPPDVSLDTRRKEAPKEGSSMKSFSLIPLHRPSPTSFARRIPLVGAIAAGRPFESYSDGFPSGGDGFFGADADAEFHRGFDGRSGRSADATATDSASGITIDPHLFSESGELIALRIEGDSMINAGILDGDYAIIRRQNTVEDGEIAAVIINGEGTLKRWEGIRSGRRRITLHPANERFEPIVIDEEDAKDVLVFGKYVGLVRGNLRI
jgi:repressor LexA